VASPFGGRVPVDPKSEPNEHQRQLWSDAIAAATLSLRLRDLNVNDFDGIFLPGGHGPMFDLVNDTDLQSMLTKFHLKGGIIGAICHGPAGLLNAKKADGSYLVNGMRLTSFTNDEEKAMKLDKAVPFLLETELRHRGANYIVGKPMEAHVERDRWLITGSNPASAEPIAAELLMALQQNRQNLNQMGANMQMGQKTVPVITTTTYTSTITESDKSTREPLGTTMTSH